MSRGSPCLGLETPKGHRNRTIAVVIVIILAVGIVGGLYYYTQVYPQPNVQVTDLVVATPVLSPQNTTVINDGRVSSSGSFDYTASLVGTYDLVFDNSFSIISTKQVAVNYDAGGSPNSASFSVPAGDYYSLPIPLAPNEQLSGTFEVSGGSGNDVNFYIQANTCSQAVSFSFTLANAGSAGGFANVSLSAGGHAFWTDRFYAPAGQNSPESGQVTIQDCVARSYSIVINSVVKG